jgi:hypothetical protein
LRDRLVAKLDADNLSGICNTDKNIPALCIGESGNRFNRRLIEGGFELDRFGFAFFYEIQDGFFVHFLFFDGVLDAFDVAAAETLHLAAEFEVAFDLFVVEDAKADDDGDGSVGHGDHCIRFEGKVGLVADGQDGGVHALVCGAQIIFPPALPERLLVRKKRDQEWSGAG